MITVQVWTYYQRFKDDRLHLKLLDVRDEKLPFQIVAVFTSQSVMLVAHSCHAGRVWGMLSKPWKMIAPICTFMTLVRYIGSFIAGAFYFKQRTPHLAPHALYTLHRASNKVIPSVGKQNFQSSYIRFFFFEAETMMWIVIFACHAKLYSVSVITS
ncbi:hypothetical protein CC2G_014087 [Coprinopsis cinerea AmutBmut pab1-1]|nr:hypothetical protein CC2G_014087 [Coprinopsis cinerea AmutBmut pab1-1]